MPSTIADSKQIIKLSGDIDCEVESKIVANISKLPAKIFIIHLKNMFLLIILIKKLVDNGLIAPLL